MTWLTAGDARPAGDRLRAILDEGDTIAVPGVSDALTALLAARAGARALYLSGAAFSAAMGLPDVGLLTREEVAAAARRITRAVEAPLVVDADTGFGGPLGVMRTVRELEDAGAAAVQIEDQREPKRCGHLEGKRVTEIDTMVEKVRAATRARRSLLVVARTDARATHGFDEAVRRGLAYREAGADVVFPEALESEDEFAAFADAVAGPLLANMTEFGKSPSLDVRRLHELGYALVIFPVSASRVAARAVGRFYEQLLRDGTQAAWLDRMMPREELYGLIRYDDYAELDRAVSRDEPPDP